MIKMNVIKQHDEQDCAPACLAMIARYYKCKYGIAYLKELTQTDVNGTNVYGIIDAAKKIGLVGEALVGTFEELKADAEKKIEIPFIAHILNEDGIGHYVVVYKITNRYVLIANPAKGKEKYTWSKFEKHWSGYMISFKKSEDFKKVIMKNKSLRIFSKIICKQKKYFLSMLLLSAVMSIMGIVSTFIFQLIIDNFLNTSDSKTELYNTITTILNIEYGGLRLTSIMLVLIGLYFLNLLLKILQSFLYAKLEKNIDFEIMSTFYQHLINLPLSSIQKRKLGDYLTRFYDVEKIRNAVSKIAISFPLNLMISILGGILLFNQSKKLFCVASIIIIIYFIVACIFVKPLRAISYKSMESNAKVQSYFKETIEGVETVKIFNAEKLVVFKLEKKLKEMVSCIFKYNIFKNTQTSLLEAVQSIGMVIILWLGFGMVINKTITLGMLATFVLLLSYLLLPVKEILDTQPIIQEAIVEMARIEDMS